MRIVSVEFAGFGPYRTKQRVDFTTFADEGLFLIAGKTGSGKSTILDAIVYALYDRVPRFGNKTGQIRSRFAAPDEPTRVVLEFTHRGTDYRITRAPSYLRQSKHGNKVVETKPEQELAERIDGQWQVLSTKIAEIARILRELFPLNAEQFLQVIMLAQGRFQEFLHASSKDRQELLRSLFGTQRFIDLAHLAQVREGAVRSKVEANMNGLHEVALQLFRSDDEAEAQPLTTSSAPFTRTDIANRATDNANAVAAANTAVATATEAYESAVEGHRKQEAIYQQQQERNRHREQRETLRLQQPKIDQELRVPLDLHRQALLVIDDVTTARDRANECSQQRTALAGRRDDLICAFASVTQEERDDLSISDVHDLVTTGIRFDEADQPIEVSATIDRFEALTEPLQQAVDALGAVVRELADADDLNRQIATATKQATESQANLETASALVESLVAQRSLLPARIAEHREVVDGCTAKLAARESVEAALEVALSHQAAANAIPGCTATLNAAEVSLGNALQQQQHAIDAEQRLIQAKLANAAGELAATLREDEPCAVCGATTHPRPAAQDQPIIEQAQLDAAATESAKAQRTVDAARAERDRINLELASLTHSAAGWSIEQAAIEVAEIQARINTLDAAAAEQRTARQELERCEQELAKLESTIESTREQRDAHQNQHVRLSAVVEQLTARRTALTGAFASLERKQAVSTKLRTGLATMLDVLRTYITAQREAVRAQDIADTKIAASPFTDAAAVRSGIMSTTEATAVERKLEDFTTAMRTAETFLTRADIAALPEALVDLAPSEAQLRDAQERRDHARDRYSVAEERQRSEQNTLDRARELLHDYDRLQSGAALWSRLAGDLRGQNERKQHLEAFVLAAHLEAILEAANARLKETTQGRYTLVLDDDRVCHAAQSGLGIDVIDVYNGERRSTTSLSGGETFLVSLSLALGLADVVSSNAGGLALETLFIDEGFGSLDAETLEVAMQTLEQLRSSGRTVGVISHVPAMHERIPTQLAVRVLPDRSSTIDLRAADPGE
ncbi:AAA family ATPase [Gulosibacter bifidus]|uniref:Nuclease SbcCD subunit C n=1 Tax=Gulosibacter bifidus TaxID=272239 RepID=A0ABW5RF95_9MICO|nr:SMC family ATPase [Gulosibacter bifidus]